MARGRVVRPRDGLLSLMDEAGLYALSSGVWLDGRKARRLGFQYVAVEMLVNGYGVLAGGRDGLGVVYEEEYSGKRFRLLLGRGAEGSDSTLEREGLFAVSPRELERVLPDPPFPLFVIDLLFKHIHTPEELSRLRLQIAVSLSVIREYLWDRHLAVTAVDDSTARWLSEAFGRHRVQLHRARPNDVLWDLGAQQVIILRPDAPMELTREELMEAEVFLIGGIVDRIPRKGVSRVLDNLVPWGKARKIALRGSVVGVPERINRIIEILLKARFVYDGDLEKAIVSTMTRRDVLARAYLEVSRRAERRGARRVVRRSVFDELREWLPLDYELFLEAARRAGVEVVEG